MSIFKKIKRRLTRKFRIRIDKKTRKWYTCYLYSDGNEEVVAEGKLESGSLIPLPRGYAFTELPIFLDNGNDTLKQSTT